MDTKIVYKYQSIKRDNKILFIFPEKPFWFVSTEPVKVIVDYYSNEVEKDYAITILKSKYNFSDEGINQLFLYIENLFDKAELFKFTEKKVFDKDIKFTIPVINVTRNCNLQCKHCYADANFNVPSKEQLTTSEMKKLIKDISILFKKINKNDLILTGGEPFLREDIIELIEYSYSLGTNVFINSNSLLITEEQMKVLKKCNVEILVSLDGATKNTHEFLRGKDTFDLTINQLKKLKSNDVNVKIAIALHSQNQNEIDKFFELAKELNIRNVSINNLNILSRASENNLKRVEENVFYKFLHSISDNDYISEYIGDTDYANVGAILLENICFTYCGIGTASLLVDYDGTIYPCYNTMFDEFKIGNVKTQNIEDLWNKSELLNRLRNLSVDNFEGCSSCPVRYYCGGGCRGETYFKYKSFTKPNPYCADIKKTIIDMMFRLSENLNDNKLFNKKIDFYNEKKLLKIK